MRAGKEQAGAAGVGRRGVRARLAWILGACLLLLTVPGPEGASSMGFTEASWAAQQAGKATLAAYTMPAPTVTTCTASPGIIGIFASLTVTWTYDASRFPGGMTGQAFIFSDAANAQPVALPASEITSAGGSASFTIHEGLLGGLLSSLSGILFGTSPYTVQVRAQANGTQWVTPVRTVRVLSKSSCQITP